jgi:hypothetical protein
VDGAHFGELLRDRDKALLVELAGSSHEDDERLARVPPLTHDQMPQVAALRLLVVRLETVLVRPVPHSVANRVAEVGGEPAALDVEHLVPAARTVEAERDLSVVLRERVLELVPVVENRSGGDDRLELEAVEAADAGEGVGDLGLLRRGLRLIREILEAAAPASGVMSARRLDARRAGFHDLECSRLGVVSLHLRDLRPHCVAGEAAPDEDDEAVQARDAVPAVGERIDLEVELLILPQRGGHEPDGIGGLAR